MEWRTAPNSLYYWLPHSIYDVNLAVIHNCLWIKKFLHHCVCQLPLIII